MSLVLQIALAVTLLLLFELYFCKRLITSLKTAFGDSGKIKTGSLIFLIILNVYPLYMISSLLFVELTQGRLYSQPEGGFFDYFVYFPFVILILTVAQSIIFFLIIDLLRLAVSPFLKKYKEKTKVAASWAVVATAAVFFIYVPARVIYDFSVFEVRNVVYTKATLPESLNNFKIAFIADIQADSYNTPARIGKYIDKLNATKPDLVLVGGDVITGTPEYTPTYINVAAEYLGDIKSRLGVYSCIGDHDHWAYKDDNVRSIREVSTALKEKKVDMVDNQNMTFRVGNTAIGVTFATSTYVDRIGEPLLDKLTENNHGSLKILLSHQPSQYLIDRAEKEHYDMMLAGHTHGGQLTFLFPFHNLTFTQLETQYVKGDFHFGNMLLVVTRGLGMSTVPFRYNSTPEITLITLKKN
ncbi:MAG TPA: metallophosphoesterase [Ignavibacteriales bacterium]|nr:metallophosphoesterase [Ignavibacteriales bacterium]